MERYVVALQIFRLDGKYFFAWTDLQSVNTQNKIA